MDVTRSTASTGPWVGSTTSDDEMERAPTYREVQRFRQRWLWALLGGVRPRVRTDLVDWTRNRRRGCRVPLQSGPRDRGQSCRERQL